MPITVPKGVERWPISKLRAYDRNARTHSAEQVEQIVASIKEFGFTNPILVAGDGEIIAGHGRLMAAEHLELREVPVVVLDHLTAEQRRAYVIADNQLALNAGWDEDLLRAELTALDDVGFDLSLVGFGDLELGSLMSGQGLPVSTQDDGDLRDDDDEDADGVESENPYTDKVDVPPYEITGPKPAVEDLFDEAKVLKLLSGIDASSLPDDEKHFLRAAAYRHAVFNFQRIAEYYAHSEADVQELMEDSALVIVDIGKAIEEGWAKLSAELVKLFKSEKGDSDAK
jgi:hypothetical protein